MQNFNSCGSRMEEGGVILQLLVISRNARIISRSDCNDIAHSQSSESLTQDFVKPKLLQEESSRHTKENGETESQATFKL